MKKDFGINLPCVNPTQRILYLFIIIMGQTQKYIMGWGKLLNKILYHLTKSIIITSI